MAYTAYQPGDLAWHGEQVVEVLSPTDDVETGCTEVTANGPRESYLAHTLDLTTD